MDSSSVVPTVYPARLYHSQSDAPDAPFLTSMKHRWSPPSLVVDVTVAIGWFKHVALLASLTACAMRSKYDSPLELPPVHLTMSTRSGRRFRHPDPAQPLLEALPVHFGPSSFIYEEVPGVYPRDADDPYRDEPARDPFVVPHIVITLVEDDWDIQRENRAPMQDLIGGKLGDLEECPALEDYEQNVRWQLIEAGQLDPLEMQRGSDLSDPESDSDMEDMICGYCDDESTPPHPGDVSFYSSAVPSSHSVRLPGDNTDWMFEVDNQPTHDEEYDEDEEEEEDDSNEEEDDEDEDEEEGSDFEDDIGARHFHETDLDSVSSDSSIPMTPVDDCALSMPCNEKHGSVSGSGYFGSVIENSAVYQDESEPSATMSREMTCKTILLSWAEDEELPPVEDFFADCSWSK
ncbi:hypothetical protein FISHEDRAFT_72781 [Fistulina hepatica ATCC 64428]|nr:hypothetical protein FISHEDRAFT_72781 [Fistulina hepatica ATCC 64428]